MPFTLHSTWAMLSHYLCPLWEHLPGVFPLPLGITLQPWCPFLQVVSCHQPLHMVVVKPIIQLENVCKWQNLTHSHFLGSMLCLTLLPPSCYTLCFLKFLFLMFTGSSDLSWCASHREPGSLPTCHWQ